MEDLVYLIGPADSSVAKIGHSTKPKSRLRQIQNMSPDKLAILTSFPGGEPVERALHRHFEPIRLHGEWFDFGEDDPVAKVQEALSVIVVDGEPATAVINRGAIETRNRQRAKWMPEMKPGVTFAPDPSETRVAGWPKLSYELAYYVPGPHDGSEARCWCGHQMGSHSSVRPHACGGSCNDTGMWCDCWCLGYEGPLPVKLSGYDLPGNNWALWRKDSAS